MNFVYSWANSLAEVIIDTKSRWIKEFRQHLDKIEHGWEIPTELWELQACLKTIVNNSFKPPSDWLL